MIEFSRVKKQHGPQIILSEASFLITRGERVGLVGPNGAGKSTIFQIITGAEPTDGGDVTLPREIRLGYLRQQLNAHAINESVLEYACRAIPELDRLHDQIVALEHDLPSLAGEARQKALDRLGNLQHDFEHLGGYEMQARAESALHGLGFKESDFIRPFQSFSGGWQMRAELVRTLIGRPDVLLLDEPSNYLDLPAVEWLQRFLREFPGTLLLISHDRYLLQTLTNVTIEIVQGRVTRYAGGFDYYLRERESRLQQMLSAKANQDRKREQTERFIDRFRAQATKARQVQSRVKLLDKMEVIEAPPEAPDVTLIRIPPPPHSGAEMLRLEDAGLSYDGTRFVLRGISLTIQRGDKTAVVGYNGMGKTTLLRMMAGIREPTEGRRVLGHQVVVGYQSQEFADTMPPEASVYRIVAEAAGGQIPEKQIRTILGSFGFSGDAVTKPCSVLSGGEKIRLAFARIFVRPPNLLVLDEPTTHLDLQGREALEHALTQYKGTVCLVSHDVTFVRRVATSILAVQDGKIERYHGDYDYYREKLAAAPPPAAAAGTSREAAPDVKKQARKDRAEQREERRRQSSQLKKQLRAAETAIEKLEAEQAGLTEQMAGGGPQVNFAAINRRLYEIGIELEKATRSWEQAGLALESLEE